MVIICDTENTQHWGPFADEAEAKSFAAVELEATDDFGWSIEPFSLPEPLLYGLADWLVWQEGAGQMEEDFFDAPEGAEAAYAHHRAMVDAVTKLLEAPDLGDRHRP